MNVPSCCCVLFRYVFRAKSACHHIQKWWRALLSGNKERSVLELKRAAIAKHAMLAFEKKERFLISLKTRRSKETNRMNNNKYKQFLRVSERNILWNRDPFKCWPFRTRVFDFTFTGSGVQQFNRQREERCVSTLHATLGWSGHAYLGRYGGWWWCFVFWSPIIVFFFIFHVFWFIFVFHFDFLIFLCWFFWFWFFVLARKSFRVFARDSKPQHWTGGPIDIPKQSHATLVAARTVNDAWHQNQKNKWKKLDVWQNQRTTIVHF